MGFQMRVKTKTEFSVGTTMRSARERLGANKLSRAGLISVTESFEPIVARSEATPD
jgi:hypothetical protein